MKELRSMNQNMTTQTILCGAVLAALMLGTAGSARSQAEVARPLPAFVSVSQGLTAHGHGEVKAKPDIARLTAGVMTQAKDQGQAAQDNARRMTALLAAIKSLKIADRDIQTQGYSVEPQYDYGNGHAPILTGYQVSNAVQVTLRDLSQAGALIDKATQAGANQVNGLSYELSNQDAVQDRALGKAVTDARRRAQTMADALGVGLGNPLSLNDGGAASPVIPLFQVRRMGMAASEAAPATPISAQEITVTADVTLVYALGAAK